MFCNLSGWVNINNNMCVCFAMSIVTRPGTMPSRLQKSRHGLSPENNVWTVFTRTNKILNKSQDKINRSRLFIYSEVGRKSKPFGNLEQETYVLDNLYPALRVAHKKFKRGTLIWMIWLVSREHATSAWWPNYLIWLISLDTVFWLTFDSQLHTIISN